MIDLSSDTVTVPTAGMRKAMYEAEVGDEQKGTAPTVNKLLEKVEALLGKEAAIFVPSGTMSNLIAVNVHVRPGEEIILAKNAHMLIAEKGGHAAYSGAIASPQEGPRGIFSVGQVEEAIRPVGRYFPQTAMVSIEHPTNLGEEPAGQCRK